MPMIVLQLISLITPQPPLFIPGIFFGGGDSPKLTTPQTAAKWCALSLFFSRNSGLQIYHENFLLMDNKHGKLFIIKQSIGCKFMLKRRQNTFGGRALRGPAGGWGSLCAPPDPASPNMAPMSSRRGQSGGKKT